MSNFYKIISTIFLAIFISLSLAPAVIFAADAQFTPQINIGEFKAGEPMPVAKDAKTVWNYIRAIYKYAIGVVGIVAAVVLMVGGIIWLTAGGNQTRIGLAKDYIAASLTGLLLALTSFLILATVNPRLVEFNPINVTTVENQNGCCSDPSGCVNFGEKSCKESGFSWMPEGICKDNQCKMPPKTCCAFDYALAVGYRNCTNGYETKKECGDKVGKDGWLGIDFQNDKQCQVIGKTGGLGFSKDLYGCK